MMMMIKGAIVVVVVTRCLTKATEDDRTVEAYMTAGFGALQEKNAGAAYALFERAEALEPWNAKVLVQLGLLDLQRNRDVEGYDRIYRAFDERAVPPITMASMPGSSLAAMAGRRAVERTDYGQALKLFRPLKDAGKDDCAHLQLATLIQPFATSVEAAKAMLDAAAKEQVALLKQTTINVRPYDPRAVGNDDQYLECQLTAFHYSFYYEADLKASLGRWIQLAVAAWPYLNYTADLSTSEEEQPLTQRKIRLGVASAFFGPSSSVLTDFGGVLLRLPKTKFDVTYISVNEKHDGGPFLDNGAARIIHVNKEPNWLPTARAKIAALKLDLLVYLDLTMSTMTTRLAMSKLARVQANTHGHPVTSGIGVDVMNYFISWAAAEVDDNPQDHYTERLVLLPKDVPHQYWTHRATVDPEGIAITDFGDFGGSWRDMTREGSFTAPPEKHWYVCMQKPFKLHPEFDAMIAGILAADDDAHIILHAIDNAENRRVVQARYDNAGINRSRITWLPVQPRSKLLALYHLADVIIDSYYASGCTTSREALEVGAVIVTLPAKYLGSRWTTALYSLLDLTDDLVAIDKDDYVKKAVYFGTHPDARAQLRAKIHARRDDIIYHRSVAVDNWVAMLEIMASAPVPTTTRGVPPLSHLLVPMSSEEEGPRTNDDEL